MYIVGQPIRTYHVVLDTNGARVSGLSIAAFTVLLARNGIATGETVFLVEVGFGYYEFRFTPLLAGTYGLVITEKSDPTIPNSAETTLNREWSVSASSGLADLAPAYTDAFCSEADIEAVTGKTYDTDTRPTADEIAAFAVLIARDLSSAMASAGQLFTPDGGGAPVPTDTDEGLTLRGLLRSANAVGAASKAEAAAYGGNAPNENQGRAEYFLELYRNDAGGLFGQKIIIGRIPEFIRAKFLSSTSQSSIGYYDRGLVPEGEPVLRSTGGTDASFQSDER